MKNYNDKSWQDANRIRLDYNNMIDSFIGGGQGFSEEQLENDAKIAKNAYEAFQNIRGSGMTDWVNLPYNQAEVVKDINIDVGELIINYFLQHKIIKVNKDSNFIIKY